MERPIRIHLGSGKYYWPGWTNIDCEGNPDVLSDISDLPMYDDNSVYEIQGIHVFEHIHRKDANKALREWHRILQPQSELVLEMPCMDKIAEMIVDGVNEPRFTLMGIFGDVMDENPYMRHQWCYTKDEITFLMEDAGFETDVEEPVFHFKKRDMRVIGVKP